MSLTPEETHSAKLNATRARQGRWGKHVFWVLVFGTLLAAIGMLAAWGWRGAVEPPPGPAMEHGVGRVMTAPSPPPADVR
jgi:hypothetical protein